MALPITSSLQNGAILPTSLLHHIRSYLEFLEDSFPLTCQLWNSLLPNTLNLELWTWLPHWNFGGKLLSIFNRYRERSQTIAVLDLNCWAGLSDDDLIPLGNYNLQTLKLHFCIKLTERALTYLKAPSSLTHLDLAHTQIRDFSRADLTRFPLKHLKISTVDISDANLETLCQLPLTFLDMTYCDRITNKGYALLAKLSLQVLKIAESAHKPANITDETVSILSNCRSLTDLTMWHCKNITDLSPLRSLPLKKLSVEGCSNISSFQIMTFLKDHVMEDSGQRQTLRYFIRRELLDLTLFEHRNAKFKITILIMYYIS